MKYKLQLNLERPISFFPQLAKALGGIEEALFVQQLYYWSDKGNDKDGWIYKTKDEWEEETTIGRRKLDTIKRKLTTYGLLETKVEKINGAPTLHYKLDIGKVQNVLMEKYENAVSNSTKRTFPPYTETTTETTTDICEQSSPVKKQKYTTLGADVLKAFEEVDPKNKTYYGNKAQREAADFLVSEYGFEKVLQIIEILPKTNKRPSYEYPKINSPYDLKEKIVKLLDSIEAMKVKNSKREVLI